MFNDRLLYKLFSSVSLLFFVIAGGRLFYLQVIKHDFFEKFVEAQSNARVEFTKDRGYILDKNGVVLAKNKKAASLYVFGKNIDNPDSLISDLQKNGIVLRNDTKKAILSKSNFIWIARQVDIEKAKTIKQKVANVNYSLEDSRFYPEGTALSGIIGYTGVDNTGLEGIEYFKNKILAGKVIPVNTIRDSRGKLILFDDGALNTRPDSAVQLTIDIYLHSIIDEILKEDLVAFRAKKGIAVALDIKTGEVLLASAVKNENGTATVLNEKNYATTYLFEPGSIFKAVTFGYLIENNMYSPAKHVNTSKPVEIHGHSIKDVYTYPSLSQKDVFVKSSNIGTVLLTRNIKNTDMYNFFLKVGFDKKIGVDGVSEEAGLLREPKYWSGLSLASLSIGQELMVTPLQIVRYYAAIANGGVAMKPVFIKSETVNNVSEKAKFSGERLISEKTAGILLNMLSEVVTTGTGKKAASNVITLGGKTGTAQLAEVGGGYSKVDYIASFAGVFPIENPQVAMIVIYEGPKSSIYGGATGATTFKRVAEQVAFYNNIGSDITKVRYAGK